MANAQVPQTWNLTMGYGSLVEFLFSFTYPSTGALYNISGASGWEYVVRTSSTDDSTPLVDITTSSSAAGVLTVTTSASTVLLTMNPAATATLPVGNYSHALWMSPGTSSAYCWFSGVFLLQGAAQP